MTVFARPIDAVLFDLDGTLVDTAPDMVATLVRLQQSRGIDAIDYELARSYVSNGALGLLRVAFPDANHELRRELHRQFLDDYRDNLSVGSRVFPGLDELLDRLDAGGHPWGIVTNKPQALTEALLSRLGLASRSACAIGGDTLPQRKPHPAPMLLASERLGVAPEHVVYVGDASRDIEAGRAAGMATVAATWGYIAQGDDPAIWEADVIASSPADLTQLLEKELR